MLLDADPGFSPALWAAAFAAAALDAADPPDNNAELK